MTSPTAKSTGHKSRSILKQLQAFESRNVTFIERDGSWPIVWESARGVHVRDEDGKRYLDLTGAFGVAAAGHANPRVVRAGQRQMARLLHAMGDVHPHALKAQLARELSRLTFERWSSRSGSRASAKTIFCNSGFEAVEAALKTALLATRKAGIIAFQGGYHGLGYGALNATHREHFRSPFRFQLRGFGRFAPFPEQKQRGNAANSLAKIEAQLRGILKEGNTGAILVEPIQTRGGVNVPPPEFLPLLRQLCDQSGALLILDEIYTGFGRTGAWFACEHAQVSPDIICLGKALTGGFPLSACVGRAELMDAAWPPSSGEAIHTSTFLGHPVGCAMALAQLQEIKSKHLVRRSATVGKKLLEWLSDLDPGRSNLMLNARGQGLLAGLELRLPNGQPATKEALRIIKTLLHRGFILLPEGEHSNVLSFTPPLTISEAQLRSTLEALTAVLHSRPGGLR